MPERRAELKATLKAEEPAMTSGLPEAMDSAVSPRSGRLGTRKFLAPAPARVEMMLEILAAGMAGLVWPVKKSLAPPQTTTRSVGRKEPPLPRKPAACWEMVGTRPPVEVLAPPKAKFLPPRMLGKVPASPRLAVKFSTQTGPLEKRPLK